MNCQSFRFLLQKGSFWSVKGLILHGEKADITLQKLCFYNTNWLISPFYCNIFEPQHHIAQNARNAHRDFDISQPPQPFHPSFQHTAPPTSRHRATMSFHFHVWNIEQSFLFACLSQHISYPFHALPLLAQGGMNVNVESRFHVCMTEQHADSLRISPVLYAA